MSTSGVYDSLVIDSIQVRFLLIDSNHTILEEESYFDTNPALQFHHQEEVEYQGEQVYRPEYLEGVIENILLNNAVYRIEFIFSIEYYEVGAC